MTEHLPLGTVIYTSVKPIFKIYFIILLGFYLAKRNILSVTTCRDISDLIVSAVMPCLIFDNVVSNLKSSDIKNIGIIFLSGTILFFSGAMIAYVIYWITNAPKRWLGGLISVGFFANISDLPIAYLQTFSKGGLVFTTEQGNKGVAYVIIFLAAQVFYQFSLGGYRLIGWDFRDELKPQLDEDEELKDYSNEKVLKTASHNKSSVLGSSTTNSLRDSDGRLMEEDREHGTPEQLSAHMSPTQQNLVANSLVNTDSAASRSIGSFTGEESLASAASNSGINRYESLRPVRTAELRQQKSQDIGDVINEYSEFDRLKHTKSRVSPCITSEVGVAVPEPDTDDSNPPSKFKTISLSLLKSFRTPNSMALIISIAIAMSPPLKALFVVARVHIPPAPDKQPPLSFIIDLTSYVGAASVPLGLLMLGATISRLKVKSMPRGFWKTAILLTALRTIVLPILGVGITTGMYKGGWYGDDIVVRFVSVLSFGVPSATALVYFTAFYTDPSSEDHLQMDCLALCLIFQYAVVYISLPFLITFTLKVSLGY
ncbi:uncharacterized protein PRCAT00003883001 [Priceomyces carsonii]|uniref:uncharacterized protein n=1 Tax=Priceomyces carsonii TaxID=28549 RepID=UPI002EDB8CD7|nr:unnamed protein product [Priceomyces carsonii]